MSSQYRKTTGYAGESLVQEYYESKWFHCRDKNFTIRGWELDLVMENADELVFVEVKVVNYVDNLHDYITPHKLSALQRTIQTYLWKFETKKQVRLDIVFVKWNDIIEIISNVEL